MLEMMLRRFRSLYPRTRRSPIGAEFFFLAERLARKTPFVEPEIRAKEKQKCLLHSDFNAVS